MWWNVKPALPCIHLGRRLKDETGRDKKKCFVGGQWRAEILVGQPLGSLWPPPRDPRERSGGRSEHRIWRREGRCAGWYAVMRRLQGALRRTGALWGKGGGRENGEAGVEMGRGPKRKRERQTKTKQRMQWFETKNQTVTCSAKASRITPPTSRLNTYNNGVSDSDKGRENICFHNKRTAKKGEVRGCS